ncbi:hypothetical protein ACUL41_12125 [Virgibacillus natechei]
MRYLTDEELRVASQFLFLSMAITVIKQDVEHIQAGAFKIKEPYVELLENMESEATNERRKLQKIMKHKHIKVTAGNRNESFSSFLFLCKGREELRTYFNPVIRNKVETIIHELMVKARLPYQPYVSAKT